MIRSGQRCRRVHCNNTMMKPVRLCGGRGSRPTRQRRCLLLARPESRLDFAPPPEPCTVDDLDACTETQKAKLQPYIDMPADERAAELAKLNKAIEKAEAETAAEGKRVKAEYAAAYPNNVRDFRAKFIPAIALLKGVMKAKGEIE